MADSLWKLTNSTPVVSSFVSSPLLDRHLEIKVVYVSFDIFENAIGCEP